MKDAQTGILEALKYSIQMELDGKRFYTLCNKESGNAAGKELFAWLAEQEDYHRKRFEEIYDNILKKKGWPVKPVRPDPRPAFMTLFDNAIKELGTAVQTQKNEILNAEKALDLEIKSRDFYKARAARAESEAEKSFFTAVSAEEQGHYLALINYKEYMSDPVGWFTRTEHHSIDGE